MSYTFGNIVSRVQTRIRDSGYSSAIIKELINDTQYDIFNEYRLRFMEANQTYTLTSGDSDITSGSGLPSNFVSAISLINTYAGAETEIPYKDIREIDQDYPDPDDTTRNTSGPIKYWYYFADTVRVFPVPDAAYTVNLRYHKKPTELSGDSDVPEVPSEFGELLVLGAAYRVLQIKDNYDQAGILQNKYDEILQKFVMRYSQNQTGAPSIMRVNRRAVGKTSF